jgi:DeoR/GlpR family transcriptional regulator of sugar metabolism
MTKEDRHKLIIDTLEKSEYAQVIDLAQMLRVSPVTIRKDLTELEHANKLFRTHGKAALKNPYINTRPDNVKGLIAILEKQKIAEYAATRIEKDDSIVISSGTTITAFAKAIRPVNHLTAITASIQVTSILLNLGGVEVIQLGGIVDPTSQSIMGHYASDILSTCSCSKLFLGVDGIDLDYGFTTTKIGEAELDRMMMKASQKTIILADSSKFHRRGFSKIGTMEEVDLIITDSNIPDKVAQRLEEMGVEYVAVQV